MDIYSKQGDNQAIVKANSSLGFYEQLDLVVSNLQSFSRTLNTSYSNELNVHIERLVGLVHLMDEEGYEPQVTTSDLTKGSKVERLGLSGEVVRLKEIHKLSNQEIADKLNIGSDTVSRFLRFYEKARPSDKAKYQRSSIFDSTQQYEEIASMVYRQIARLENDPEQHVKYIGELRQVIKAAQEWMKQANQMQKIEEIKQIITDILLDIAPEQRERVIKRFSEIGLRRILSS